MEPPAEDGLQEGRERRRQQDSVSPVQWQENGWDRFGTKVLAMARG
jgi:hypothetical protein